MRQSSRIGECLWCLYFCSLLAGAGQACCRGHAVVCLLSVDRGKTRHLVLLRFLKNESERECFTRLTRSGVKSLWASITNLWPSILGMWVTLFLAVCFSIFVASLWSDIDPGLTTQLHLREQRGGEPDTCIASGLAGFRVQASMEARIQQPHAHHYEPFDVICSVCNT